MVQQKFYLHIKNKLCSGKPVEKKNNEESKESLELNKNDVKDTEIVGKNLFYYQQKKIAQSYYKGPKGHVYIVSLEIQPT